MINPLSQGFGRDSNGRFRKGHKSPGPGRPPKQAIYNAHFDKIFKKEHFEKLVWAMYAQALQGEKDVAKYLCDRFMGKVKDVSDVNINHNPLIDTEETRKALGDLITEEDILATSSWQTRHS